MAPIGERLNHIYAGIFLGWTHEDKTIYVYAPLLSSSPTNVINNTQFSQDVCFCHWRHIFLCHYPWKVVDIPALLF